MRFKRDLKERIGVPRRGEIREGEFSESGTCGDIRRTCILIIMHRHDDEDFNPG